MIHNGTAVRDENGNITGYIYGEVEDLDMNKPEEPKPEPKKTTRKTSTTKK